MNDILDKVKSIISYIINLFNSIVIVSNPIVNIILKIGILVICIIIIKKIFTPRRSRTYRNTRNYAQSEKPIARQNIRTIDDCISNEDMKFQLKQAEQDIINTIEKNKREIADVLRKANSSIDTAWLNSCNKVLNISNTLDNNLAYHSQRNLQTSKFQYYTHLHFRSMIAADIVHNEFEKIDQSFREVNNFIVQMKSNSAFRGAFKTQVHNNKDLIKSIRQVYLNRVQEMNKRTATLRDKIGAECGERGRQWWEDRTRHKQKAY